MNEKTVISNIGEDKINTSSNIYSCHVYEVVFGTNKIFFKFYISVTEVFNTQFDDINSKEIDEISEFIKHNTINNGDTHNFLFRHSDYFVVNPKNL